MTVGLARLLPPGCATVCGYGSAFDPSGSTFATYMELVSAKMRMLVTPPDFRPIRAPALNFTQENLWIISVIPMQQEISGLRAR